MTEEHQMFDMIRGDGSLAGGTVRLLIERNAGLKNFANRIIEDIDALQNLFLF